MTLGFCDCNQGRLPCTCKPDWSTAPADATHWGPETENYHASWYRHHGATWSAVAVDSYRVFKSSWNFLTREFNRTDLEARP